MEHLRQVDGPRQERPGEGKLYLRAVRDVFSGRIVRSSINSRMKSRLAIMVLQFAVARRGPVAGCIVHSDPGLFRQKFVSTLALHGLVGLHRPGRRGRRQRGHGKVLRAAAEERPGSPTLENPSSPASSLESPPLPRSSVPWSRRPVADHSRRSLGRVPDPPTRRKPPAVPTVWTARHGPDAGACPRRAARARAGLSSSGSIRGSWRRPRVGSVAGRLPPARCLGRHRRLSFGLGVVHCGRSLLLSPVSRRRSVE